MMRFLTLINKELRFVLPDMLATPYFSSSLILTSYTAFDSTPFKRFAIDRESLYCIHARNSRKEKERSIASGNHMQPDTVKHVRNFRDLGGITCSGGQVKCGLLLRSGHLAKLKPHDVETLLDRFDLGLVVDLRTATERAEKPDAAIPGAENLHAPLFSESTVGITHERASDGWAALEERLPDMQTLYRSMVSGENIAHLSKAVGLIVDAVIEGRAVLYHCTEGKDRTGIVTLVLLAMLGATQEAIAEDYLRTNETAQSKANRLYWLVRLLKRDKTVAEKMRSVFVADTPYLNAAIDEVNATWGSIAAFTVDGLGIDEQRQAAFRHAACKR